MGDVRTVSASSDDSACAPTQPLATSSPTGDLSEEELRSVCALWSEAFPTAPGRDRYAEAVARLATAGATAEMVHAVFERVLEKTIIDIHHDIAIHLDKPAIAVIGKAAIIRMHSQTGRSDVV